MFIWVVTMGMAIALLLSYGCARSSESLSEAGSETEGTETVSHEGADADMSENESMDESNDANEMNSALSSASTQFGLDLLTQLVGDRPEENLLISPTSVTLALALAYNGASGETQEAIASTLHWPEMERPEVNDFYQRLLTRLVQDEAAESNVELAIANSLWSREDLTLKPEFLERAETRYRAEVTALDFADERAPDQINAWVSEATGGRIPSIIDSISPDAAVFLINAVYFNGEWTYEFDPEQTRDRPFTRLDGSQMSTPLMQQTRSFPYLETDQVQAIQLPYGTDQNLSMMIVLPSETQSWSDFLESLNADTWDTWREQLSQREGTLALPRFQIDDQIRLNDALQAMGMAIAFDPNQADFSDLSDESTFISQVQHHTFIEVTEAGTEAAASTSVGISITSATPPTAPFEMVVDRPFVFAIADDATQTLLFLGGVVHPAPPPDGH